MTTPKEMEGLECGEWKQPLGGVSIAVKMPHQKKDFLANKTGVCHWKAVLKD